MYNPLASKIARPCAFIALVLNEDEKITIMLDRK
jgi:hypothetical protein